MSRLLQSTRKFWFNNISGVFGKWDIKRAEIHRYGGPNPEFNHCETCQWKEWLSRLQQEDWSIRHDCRTDGRCYSISKKQGNENWANYHQNFHFAEGRDDSLDAPKCLLLLPEGIWKLHSRFFGKRCDFGTINLRRQLAQACQIWPVKSLDGVNWRHYDFLYMQNTGDNPSPSPRPDIPIIMYGWDFWDGREKYQRDIDLWKPDFFLTPMVTAWKKLYKWPKKTKFRFAPSFPTRFFRRPNLGEKMLDLLVIGDVYNPRGLYAPHVQLNKQIGPLADRYRIEFSNLRGGGRNLFEGPLEFTVNGTRRFVTGSKVDKRWPNGSRVRLLNKWLEYIGSAQFVVFGPMNVKYQFVVAKYFECLGSGAIPIFPKIPDLKYLGIQPNEHYIPLSEIWRNNARLEQILSRPGDYAHIAEAAVTWCEENSEKMQFDDFEDLIREVTEKKYPRRLI